MSPLDIQISFVAVLLSFGEGAHFHARLLVFNQRNTIPLRHRFLLKRRCLIIGWSLPDQASGHDFIINPRSCCPCSYHCPCPCSTFTDAPCRILESPASSTTSYIFIASESLSLLLRPHSLKHTRTVVPRLLKPSSRVKTFPLQLSLLPHRPATDRQPPRLHHYRLRHSMS